jgi:hypothetical protein
MTIKGRLKTAARALGHAGETAMRTVDPGMDRAYGRLEAPLKPCPHPDDWCPTTLHYAADDRKPSETDVVCMHPGCGWAGRVPFAMIATDPDTEG